MTPDHRNQVNEFSSRERQRVDAYWLALDLHALAMAALPISKRGNARRSQIERASVKAFSAVGLAANGDEQEAKDCIATAFNAADSVLILMQGLVSEGRLNMEAYAVVAVFANRLLARLRELAKLPLGDWPLSAAPPDANPEERSGDSTAKEAPAPGERTSVLVRLGLTQIRAARLMVRFGADTAEREREVPPPLVDEEGDGALAGLMGSNGDASGISATR